MHTGVITDVSYITKFKHHYYRVQHLNETSSVPDMTYNVFGGMLNLSQSA